MKFFFLLYFFMVAAIASGQDRWNIKYNGRLLLNASREDTARNRITLERKSLKTGYLFVTFTQQDKNLDGWQRTISVDDPEGNILLEKKSSTLKLDAKVLKEWFKTKTSLRMYTWKIPANPSLAAAVRVRRLHLCTIVLQ